MRLRFAGRAAQFGHDPQGFFFFPSSLSKNLIRHRGHGSNLPDSAAACRGWGTPSAAEIYVKSPRGPSISGVGRTGVVFTLNDAELSEPAFKSYSVSVRNAGQALPVGHAIQFCKDYILELKDF